MLPQKQNIKICQKGLCEDVAFKGVGKQYILFAVQEPKLFRLLFMSEKESVPNLSSILPEIDESYEQILNSIVDGYGFSTEKRNGSTNICGFIRTELPRFVPLRCVGLQMMK